MLNIRNFLAFAIILLALVLSFWIYRNYRNVAPPDETGGLNPHVDLALEAFSYTETVDGRRRWTLEGDRAGHDFGEGVTMVGNVRMVFYDDDLGEVVLTAKDAKMTENPPVVDFHGDVIVENPGRYVLYTDDLRYFVEERTAFTDGPVKLVSDTMEVRAEGMRFYSSSRKVDFLSKVESRMSISGRRFARD